jgi:hypothetical protein
MLIVGLVYWAVARRVLRTWHTALVGEERREMRAEYSQRLYRGLEALDPRATMSKAPVRCGGLAGGDVGAPGGCRHVDALGCLDAGQPRRVGTGKRPARWS